MESGTLGALAPPCPFTPWRNDMWSGKEDLRHSQLWCPTCTEEGSVWKSNTPYYIKVEDIIGFFFLNIHTEKKKKATIQKFWKLREKKNKNMDVKNTLGSAVTKADPQRQDWTYTFSAKCDTGAAGRHAEPRPRAAHHGAPRTRQSPSPFAQPSTEEGTCIRTKASNWCTRKFGKWTLK